jgi:hypothetical protein
MLPKAKEIILCFVLFSVWDPVNICKHKTKFSQAASVIYGLAYWPLVPKVVGSNPVRNRLIF